MLPRALYLPEFNSLVACSYNANLAERLTSRHFDIGKSLENSVSPIEEIIGYTMNQSQSYMQKSLELVGIADILLKEYIKNGAELLRADKIKNYARRKIATLLNGRKNTGREYSKSISAISCSGYRFTELPDDFTVIRLADDYIAASQLFVKTASHMANRLGYNTIVSRAVDSENAPLHLMIPDIKTVFISESAILKTKFSNSTRIGLERFYNQNLLASRQHYITFFEEYIRKMYNEAALYARICMDIKNQGRKLLMPFISDKPATEIASEIIYGILNT